MSVIMAVSLATEVSSNYSSDRALEARHRHREIRFQLDSNSLVEQVLHPSSCSVHDGIGIPSKTQGIIQSL